MDVIEQLKQKVMDGGEITKEEALSLVSVDLEALANAANEIRKKFCGNGFDICTIINAKSGRCSEDCRYCAQSAHYKTTTECYPLLKSEEIVKEASRNDEQGILRFSLVTSGKRLSDEEVEQSCEAIKKIRETTNIHVCVSMGLLGEEQFRKLRKAGASRVHNNLESSRNYFKQICTTHEYEEKIATIEAARKAGMSVCSGGIMGLGESMEDRIDMAMELKRLQIKSVPVNMLNPIPGTPLEHNKRLTDDEMRRIIAIYRFILPDASIRLAGGRGLLLDKGRGCFLSGANAAISGDMLTTQGINCETDLAMIKELGFEVKLWNE